MRDTLGVLLAGGAGERLFPLTRDRAKPAVPFAGQYRIIDITLSNCINSDLSHVYILTQYKALSLNRHIREGWGPVVANELGEFIEILPPMQRVSKSWYQGTADAVYQNIYSIGSEEPKYVIILSGDHIYKMNYARMLQQHRDSGAEVTLATLPIRPEEVSQFGVVEVARNGEVIGFEEKPKETKSRSPFMPDMVDASMGIYIFNTDILLPELMRDAEDPDSKHDFGHDILPNLLGRCKMHAFNFVDENKQNRPLLARRGHPRRLLRSQHGRGRRHPHLQPVRQVMAHAHPRLPVPARQVRLRRDRPHRHGHQLHRSRRLHRLGLCRAQLRRLARRPRQLLLRRRLSIVFSHVNIGRHCRIRHAIIDRDVHIPDGTVIGYDPNEDKRNYFVSPSGLTVVTRDYSVYENPVSPEFLSQNF